MRKRINKCVAGAGFVILVPLGLAIFTSMPVYGTTYYVSLLGNDNWPGTSPDSAWRHIAHACSLVVAGDSALVDTGTYLDEHATIVNSGDSANAIVIEGYNGRPLLDGIDRTGIAFDNFWGKEYIILKNLKIINYNRGINIQGAEYITAEDITMRDLGETEGGMGVAMRSGSQHCTIRNCNITDASHFNIWVSQSKHFFIEACTLNAVTTQGQSSGWQPDYHIELEEADSGVIENCVATNFHYDVDMHAGHAFAFKSNCDHNLVIGCEAYNVGEFFVVSHYSHHNEFRDCIGYDEGGWHSLHWNFGLVARDGAYDNKFIKCKMYGATVGFLIVNTPETTDTTKQRNNIFENCIVCNYPYGHLYAWGDENMIYLQNAISTTFKNCVMAGLGAFILYEQGVVEDNRIVNSIILDLPNQYLVQPCSLATSYTDFWNVGFTPPSGVGNMNVDPLLANPDTSHPGDYHLKSEYGRWNGSAWINDDTTSPCIDAGDPADDYSNEPEPNGDRINMGAYGNTSEASKSPESGTKEKISSLPKIYSLMQNRPNPFRVWTQIEYVLSCKGVVKLSIFDIAGKRTTTLVNGVQKAGYHKIRWNGEDNNGKKVASGVYFYGLKTGNFLQTKKLLLLR